MNTVTTTARNLYRAESLVWGQHFKTIAQGLGTVCAYVYAAGYYAGQELLWPAIYGTYNAGKFCGDQLHALNDALALFHRAPVANFLAFITKDEEISEAIDYGAMAEAWAQAQPQAELEVVSEQLVSTGNGLFTLQALEVVVIGDRHGRVPSPIGGRPQPTRRHRAYAPPSRAPLQRSSRRLKRKG